MSHASCLMSFASWLMTHVSCLLSHEIWDMTPWRRGTWDMRHKHEPWSQQVRDMRIEPWDMTRASWLMDHDSWLMFYISRFTFSHLSWLKPHVVWPTSHVSCFLSHSFFTYHVSYGSSWAHGSCFMCHVPCFHVSCFIFQRIMSHVLSWLLFHVLCSTFHVSSLMPHVPCLTFDIGGMRHAWDMRHEDLRHEAWKKHEAWDARHETSCLLSLVSCLMPHDSCFLSPVFW